MIATIKMHEKDVEDANCSAGLYNSIEISMHFVTKIIEIDSYSRRKLTENFLITVTKHPSTLHPFLKI